ncbi:MAG: PQQ-binding-like beta-propeller repeat protein [Alphaproteobacteria bacterium]|nr:PQQ-binding-like beta-propeller repeat protein [Alphaproteobacteria bacterium]
MPVPPSLLPLLLAAPLWAGEPVEAGASRPEPAVSAPDPAPVALAATVTTFPTWRGDGAQTGVVPGRIEPAALVLRWSATFTDAIVAAAVVDETTVVVGSKDGHVRAFERSTGAVRWDVATGGPVEGPALLVGGVAVVGSRDGKVRALELATGTARWVFDAGAEVTGGATFVPAAGEGGESVVIGAYDGRVHRLRLADGSPVWAYGTGSYVYGSPAVRDGVAVVGGCDGFVHTVGLADGAAVAKVPVEAYVGSSVAWGGDLAYTGHFGNKVIGFVPATAEVRWTHFERSFAYLSSPAVTDEAVILGGRDRVLHALDPKTGEALWWFPAKGKIDSSPVVAGPHVLVGSHDGRLYVVEADTGAEVRAFDLGAAVSASPAVAGGWVWIGAEDGVLHAFGPPAEPQAPAKGGKGSTTGPADRTKR